MLTLVLSLVLAVTSIYISFTVGEEVESMMATIVAVICAFCALIWLPLLVKVLLVVGLLLSYQSAKVTSSDL